MPFRKSFAAGISRFSFATVPDRGWRTAENSEVQSDCKHGFGHFGPAWPAASRLYRHRAVGKPPEPARWKPRATEHSLSRLRVGGAFRKVKRGQKGVIKKGSEMTNRMIAR